MKKSVRTHWKVCVSNSILKLSVCSALIRDSLSQIGPVISMYNIPLSLGKSEA